MQHGLIIEQRIEKYTSNVDTRVDEEIINGWRVVTMMCTPAANIYVVYERFVTACGDQVTCLGCLAQET